MKEQGKKGGSSGGVKPFTGFHMASDLGGIALLAMAVLGFVHVVCRWLFKHPLLGTPEIIEFMNVILVCCGILWAHREKSHLSIDFLVVFFPEKIRRVTDVIMDVISLVVCFFIAWKNYELAQEMQISKELSFTLGISVFPFVYIVALTFVLWGLLIGFDIYKGIMRKR